MSESADESDLPSPGQKRTELDDEKGRDSAPLPKSHEALLNDGIVDLASRRSHRPGIVIAALVALGVFLANVTVVILTLTYGYTQAIKPEMVAKSAVVELAEKVAAAASSAPASTPHASSTASAVSASEKRASAPEQSKATTHDASDANQPRTVKVEARIFGEIKDSMVPLVALVSILTVAIVVILATMLKAAFAAHPHAAATSDKEKKDSDAFIPAIEACKSFIETLKSAFSKN